MMMTDEKKAITTIMGRRRNPDGSTAEAPMVPSEVSNEENESDPRLEASKDIMSALNEKHPGKLMEAMANFHDLHSMRDDAEEPSDD